MTDHLANLKAHMEGARVEVRSGYQNPAVVFAKGVDEFHCTRYPGPVWRFDWISTYGNGHFVYGPGCDASGYVIRDPEVLAHLEGLVQ